MGGKNYAITEQPYHNTNLNAQQKNARRNVKSLIIIRLKLFHFLLHQYKKVMQKKRWTRKI